MTIENVEIDINLNTNSVSEYTEQLIQNLEKVEQEMNVTAMDSYYENVLRGKKEMLQNIITYILKTK